MELVFVCPEKDAAFPSRYFEIVDNNGVRTDAEGNKTLDAKVALTEPCPFCGQKHRYHAGDMTCPFGG